MDLVIFEEHKPYVLEAFCEGDFDYIEAASEVVETDFFRFIQARRILPQLAESYPSPRKKHDVPMWLYVAANLSMRLHGVHAFRRHLGGVLEEGDDHDLLFRRLVVACDQIGQVRCDPHRCGYNGTSAHTDPVDGLDPG